MCFTGDKSKLALSLLKCGREQGLARRTERVVQTCTWEGGLIHILHIACCFILLCMDLYTPSNAWQRSYVRSPAIKKKKKKKSPRGSWVERGKKGGRGGVCFSSAAKQPSKVDMEKLGNEKMVQRAAESRLSRETTNPELRLSRSGPFRVGSV